MTTKTEQKTATPDTEANTASTTAAAPKMTYETVKEGAGVRVTATYGGEQANAYAATEDEAKTALRKALVPSSQK